MTRNLAYKDWSQKFHLEHADQPLAVQIELTYSCPLHCVYCYCDCYNNPEYTKTELSTQKMKIIIDKLHHAGCLWLCYTGGDPLIRPDFLELYEHAKKRGFVVTILTSLAVLPDRILARLIKKPPFAIEITLNAATKKTYEQISQVKGSFASVITNIRRVLAARLPLKIKTLLNSYNFHEIGRLRHLIESFGAKFRPGTEIRARLNGDTGSCRYRLPVAKLLQEENHQLCSDNQPQTDRLFNCAAGNWQWQLSPHGKLQVCPCLKEPAYDLLNGDMAEGVRTLADYVRTRKFLTDSECKNCKVRHLCRWCPGKAKLEVGDEEMPIPYYCRLAQKGVFEKRR